MTHTVHTAGCCGPVVSNAPVAVTINPEARVSVVRTRTPIGDPALGTWHTVAIEVINEGFVAGSLSVTADPVCGVEFDLPGTALTGERRQPASFRIRLAVNAVDVTLTFRAESAAGGLAKHSTVHFLVRCESGSSNS